MAGTPNAKEPMLEQSLGGNPRCARKKALAVNYVNQGEFYVIENTLLIEFRMAKRGKKGELKIKDDPTMLMKTKEERSDILTDPTMLMIIKDLRFVTHDVDDKKCS
jgi:hypothetical protein